MKIWRLLLILDLPSYSLHIDGPVVEPRSIDVLVTVRALQIAQCVGYLDAKHILSPF